MIKVLSLFDGIAGARQALKNLNIDCEYYASEIDRFAIKVARDNHEDIKYLTKAWQEYGIDVKEILNKECDNLPEELQEIVGYKMQQKLLLEQQIDLLIGGSPCQDLSAAKRYGKGLEGEKSGLFFEYVRILNEVKPKFFILENVASMKKQNRDKISEILGVEPIKIDSALLTAQQRKRYYWVGKLVGDKYEQVKIEQPEDKDIRLKDILESGDTEKLKSYCITATYSRACPQDYFLYAQRQMIWKGCAMRGRHLIEGKRKDIKGAKTEQRIEFRSDEKSNCLTTVSKDSLVGIKDLVRKLTPIEYERLQGFPDDYSKRISTTQRYKALGNSFTVPVIEHLLKNIL